MVMDATSTFPAHGYAILHHSWPILMAWMLVWSAASAEAAIKRVCALCALLTRTPKRQAHQRVPYARRAQWHSLAAGPLTSAELVHQALFVAKVLVVAVPRVLQLRTPTCRVPLHALCAHLAHTKTSWGQRPASNFRNQRIVWLRMMSSRLSSFR